MDKKEKEYKLTLSTRISPDLKDRISEDALQASRTLSNQAELMLKKYYRDADNADYKDDQDQDNENHREELENVETELVGMGANDQSLRIDILEKENHIQGLEEKNATQQEQIQELEEKTTTLQERTQELEEETTTLREQSEDSEREITEQQETLGKSHNQIEILRDENQALREAEPTKAYELLSAENEKFSQDLTKLKKKYPQLDYDQIIRAAVACCAANEGIRFTNHNLSSYLRSNPNFLTLKNNAA